MPQYAYIWVRYGTSPGLAFVVPGYRMEQVRANLRIYAQKTPELRWHEFRDLEHALEAVGYAIRTGGGKWAGPCGLLFCATDSHNVCFRANIAASEWLWYPFAPERSRLLSV